jgi:cytosine/adenosine deaminase-related metal-dependent hydrolase
VTQSSTRGLTFVNASLGTPTTDGATTTVRVTGSRIAAVGGDPHPADRVVDLHGDRLLPGLINAHDHLHLNSFPPLGHDPRFRNVGEWIAEVQQRTREDDAFRAVVDAPRERLLLHGGLKNLLSGVTTVAHHDPLYPALTDESFPTRMVEHYGWSHSLGIDGESQVRRAYAATPKHWPWIIHAAEGVDDEAAGEWARLEALGCVAANTLIVHGVALGAAERARLADAHAGLAWCPASNMGLFGRSADVTGLVARGRVALGTDSRLSGERDLLRELRAARDVAGLDDSVLQAIITGSSACLLRLTDRGMLVAGMLADLLVLPRSLALSDAERCDVRMVVVGGQMRYGDVDYAHAMGPASQWQDVIVDGRNKALERGLANRLARAGVDEPGLVLPQVAGRAA